MNVTLGGLTVGLAILAAVLTWWFMRARFKWARILPFFCALVFGTLLIVTVGGLLGGAAAVALWGSNAAGDLALVYGVGGGTPDVTRTGRAGLTDGGHAVVIVLAVVYLVALVLSRRARSWLIALGILAGVCLGLSAGWAGWIAGWAGAGVNALGALLTGGH
ncbi:hypothetical protein [Streptomyces sp. YIM 98790]|uniref:hypothetical protein n=1 Tax=Streptomyces sp. YIM 98790 TaxID=2689077 RepID=UPI00140AB92A|nr:hypothetical protein [Streptomyces sp. YIM 98790]